MPEPIIAEKIPTTKYLAPNPLYIRKATGEFCIRLVRPGTVAKWISLGTTDRLEALRRLKATGVEKILEVSGDEDFKEAIVESLTAPDRRPLESVIDEWLADKALRVQPSSMQHPRVISGQFLRLVGARTDVAAITPAKITAWVNTAPTLTRRQRRLCVLEELFQFAFEQGYRKDNPAKRAGFQTNDLTFEDMERTVRDAFTKAEFEQFLACEKIQGFWRHAIQLGWWLGLRMSDVCCLQWGSLCAVPGKLVVWQVKTRRRVELDLSDPILGGGVLNEVIAEMKANVTDAVYCFPAWHELYISTNRPHTTYAFRDVCVLIGLDGVKTFHCFRKSAAQRWEDAGRSIKEIGRLLGHEGTGNTGIYLERTPKS